MSPNKNNTKELNVFALLLPELKDLINRKDFLNLKNALRTINSIDIAAGWSELNSQEKLLIFKLLVQHKAIEVFEDLKYDEQKFLLDNLNSEEMAKILNEMAPDERTQLFKDLPTAVMRKFMHLLKTEEASNLKKLLSYDENTAGGVMTTDVVITKKDMTARKALMTLQDNLTMSHAKDVYSVYVTDDERKLLGVLSLQTLLKAPQDMLVKDIMSSPENRKINVNTEKSKIVNAFSKYDLLDMPVVDSENYLLGVITIDDVVDLMERNATRDLYEVGKMSSAHGEILSYDTASVPELIKRRAGWLVALLLFDFLTGTVIKNFETTLSAVVALAFFIPMLLDTGGNAGAQTSITVIRGLATGDVNFKNVWRVVKLEIAAALLMAAIVGAIAWGRAILLQKDFFISIVVGMTMFIIVILAIITGLTLPLLSKKIGLDPAALAGPITTSIVDVVGLLIYFKIAQQFIPVLKF